MANISRMIALTLLGIALIPTSCTTYSPNAATGVAAPGHNWLEGGGG